MVWDHGVAGSIPVTSTSSKWTRSIAKHEIPYRSFVLFHIHSSIFRFPPKPAVLGFRRGEQGQGILRSRGFYSLTTVASSSEKTRSIPNPESPFRSFVLFHIHSSIFRFPPKPAVWAFVGESKVKKF